MKTNITRVCASVFGTMLLAGAALNADAQLMLTGTSYHQNFNDLSNGFPAGWRVDSGSTATALGADVSATFTYLTPAANTGWNNTSGRFKNVASGLGYANYAAGTSALQLADTNRALAVRQTGSFEKGVAFVLQIANTTGLADFDMSFNIQGLDTGSARISTWIVDYGFGNNPTTFTPATTTGTMTTGNKVFGNNNITVDFGTALNNQTGPVFIRIVSLTSTSGGGNRTTTAIDNVNLTWTGAASATNILATNYTPTGNNIPLSTAQLSVKYDNKIAKGTGNFSLIKHGSATPVGIFDVTSTAVTISNDSTAIIDLGSYDLENNAQYFVHASAGIFTKQGGTTLPSLAIADSTTWTFSTVDTVTPPPPTALTSLDEKFLNCINTEMGVFVQYNETGSTTWRCSRFGRNKATAGADSFAVYINGGSGSGISTANKDWLISKAPFDFSAMSTPTLSFWQTRRYSGSATRKVLVSTNYIAGTDPSTATWTELNIQDLTNDPAEDTWTQISGINLTAHKVTPFYLAFTYECGTNGTYELGYDDIKVQNVTSIKPVNGATVGIQVVGEATSNQINLNIDMNSNDQVELELFDLLGRKVASQKAKLNNGANRISMSNLNLGAGLYVVRVIGTNGFGTVKAVVR